MRRLVILLALILLSGCGSGNTLAQDLAWERVDKCKGLGAELLVTRVDPNGTIWYQYRGPRHEFEECLRKAASEQASRGMAATPPTVKPAQPITPVSVVPITAPLPVWKTGDEWAFRYEGPTAKGTYVWTVDREESVGGVPNYVIKTGSREIFYRKDDIATTRETVDGKAVLLNTPPRLRYVWPLEVGRTWEQSVHEERPVDRQTTEREDTSMVEAEETITVPAGTFRTLRIVHRNKLTGNIRYEEWYSPELKQAVMMRERLETGLRVRECIAYKLK
jgi:hypothetical protein